MVVVVAVPGQARLQYPPVRAEATDRPCQAGSMHMQSRSSKGPGRGTSLASLQLSLVSARAGAGGKPGWPAAFIYIYVSRGRLGESTAHTNASKLRWTLG